MHQLLEQQIRQWLDGRSDDLPPQLLAAIDEAYRQADTTQTELRNDIQQARELAAVGKIAGGIAHDFNNLLTVIKGYCDLCLRLSSEDDGPVPKGLQQISQATERAVEMTVQLLALSRRRKPDPIELEFDGIIESFLPMLRRLIDGDIDLTLDTQAPEASINADRGSLQQLLLNLVIHAQEGLEPGDSIQLKTQLEVDGEQRPSDRIQLIAEVSSSTGNLRQATGLAVLDTLSRDVGGELDLPDPAKKPTLVISIPLCSASRAEPPAPVLDAAATRTRILVVEDEEPVRLMLEALLTDQGHRVTLASSPEIALEHFNADPSQIDLLVTDIVMPGMHGPEMAEIMKEIRPDLAVLFISGYDPAARERRGAPAPGGAFLQKPFDATTLSLKIREVLGALKATS